MLRDLGKLPTAAGSVVQESCCVERDGCLSEAESKVTVEPTEPGCAEEGDSQGGPSRDQFCWECDHCVGFGSMDESLGEGGELGAEGGDALRHRDGVGL